MKKQELSKKTWSTLSVDVVVVVADWSPSSTFCNSFHMFKKSVPLVLVDEDGGLLGNKKDF